MSRARFAAACLLAACLPAPQPLAAQAAASSAAATESYEQARQAYDDGELETARTKIEESIAAMPSPNSDLLLGHILRALGRKVEAMKAYERAAAQAKERVVSGQSRFEPTVAEASKWSGLLGASLAALEIVLVGQGPKATVRVGAATYALEPAAHGPVSMSVWLEPGAFAVEVVRGERRAARSVSLTAGSSQRLSFELGDPTPPPRTADRSYAPPLGAWISFGVGALGMGTFAALGAWTLAIDSGLEDCSPACPQDRRQGAERGEALQIGANVGVAIGGAALLTGVIWWIVEASAAPTPRLPVRATRGKLELRF